MSYNIIIFVPNASRPYLTISNGIFKFNFLAVVVSEISGGKFTFTLRPLDATEASAIPHVIVFFLISTF